MGPALLNTNLGIVDMFRQIVGGHFVGVVGGRQVTQARGPCVVKCKFGGLLTCLGSL